MYLGGLSLFCLPLIGVFAATDFAEVPDFDESNLPRMEAHLPNMYLLPAEYGLLRLILVTRFLW